MSLMSQTETLLLIVLGFATASLLALFIGRFAWNMALRIGAKRMQKQVPSTVAELQSERDRLRAEYAMLSQRLGARLEGIKDKMADQMAEVTRHRNRLDSLTSDLDRRDAEIITLRERVTGLERELKQKSGEVDELRAELGHRDQKISALDSELILASTRENEAKERLRQRIGELTDMSQQIAASRRELVVTDENAPRDLVPVPAIDLPPPPTLDENFAAAERETQDLQRELARLDETWGDKLADLEKKRDGGDTPAAPDNIIALGNRVRQQQ